MVLFINTPDLAILHKGGSTGCGHAFIELGTPQTCTIMSMLYHNEPEAALIVMMEADDSA